MQKNTKVQGKIDFQIHFQYNNLRSPSLNHIDPGGERMSRRFSLVFILLILSLLSMQCASDLPTSPTRGDNEVWIEGSRFSPQTLTVSRGTTVIWTNKDDIRNGHTVDSGAEMNPTLIFNLTLVEEGDSDTHRFNTAGTFNYYCALHGETGRIIVQ
jgi:plastocyanin